MAEFKYRVVVEAESREEAERVIAERVYTDADYGFKYRIWVQGAINEPVGSDGSD